MDPRAEKGGERFPESSNGVASFYRPIAVVAVGGSLAKRGKVSALP